MIQKIAAQIRSLIGRRRPETAIILGSGLGALADEITDSVSISYADIDGFPQSTVQGHGGKLIIGRLEDKEILCMQGRFHLYEVHKPQVINTVIKAFQLLGIKNLIVTNAAGSLNPEFAPGSLMLIKDHINFSGTNPLIGPNDDRYGPRFPGMADAYTAEWRHKIKELAAERNIPLNEGVYLWALGPCYETAAEIKMFRLLGGDAVGMSTVPEVIVANHCGIKVFGVSVISDLGVEGKIVEVSHEEVQKAADEAQPRMTTIMRELINRA